MYLCLRSNGCELVTGTSYQQSTHVPVLVPRVPRDMSRFSRPEWFNIYRPYVKKILNHMVGQICSMTIEGYDTKWDTEGIERYLLKLMYAKSSNTKKSFYFLK